MARIFSDIELDQITDALTNWFKSQGFNMTEALTISSCMQARIICSTAKDAKTAREGLAICNEYTTTLIKQAGLKE